MVRQKDVLLHTTHVDLKFPYPTKHKWKGIMLKLPELLLDEFNDHFECLDKKRLVDSRFLSNMNENKGTREQNIGEYAMSKISKDLARRLVKDPSNLLQNPCVGQR